MPPPRLMASITASYSARSTDAGGMPNRSFAAGPTTSVFPIAIRISELVIPGADPGGDTHPPEDADDAEGAAPGVSVAGPAGSSDDAAGCPATLPPAVGVADASSPPANSG